MEMQDIQQDGWNDKLKKNNLIIFNIIGNML